jgi:hypothetical protein
MALVRFLTTRSSLKHSINPSFALPKRFASHTTSDGTRADTSAQPIDPTGLKHDVIKLYKNLIYLSREWPTDLRPQIKQAFMKNRSVQDPAEIRKLIDRGEYVCREIIATYHLRKYRAMKRRYYNEHRDRQMEEVFKEFNS